MDSWRQLQNASGSNRSFTYRGAADFCGAFIGYDWADISVLSQVVILSVYEKKNGTDEI